MRRKTKCKRFPSPYDVFLYKPGQNWKESGVVVEPDLCVACDPRKRHEHGRIGAPDLVVEILSPLSSKKDLSLKFKLYEEYKVPEYWIVDPKRKTVVQYLLKGVRYKTIAKAQGMDAISPDLKIPVQDIFQGLDGR